MEALDMDTYVFCNPCSLVISGATQSGKTSWLKKVIDHKNQLFEHPQVNTSDNQDPPDDRLSKPFTKIIYYYSIWQDLFNEMSFVEFRKGSNFKSDDLLNTTPEYSMIIFDDLMNDVVNSKEIEELFISGSHHKNLTLVYINQNLFHSGKYSKTIRLNSTYMVLFKNLQDVKQVTCLGSQLGMSDILPKAFQDILKNSQYGYLIIDLSLKNTFPVKIKSNIFPGEIMTGYT